MVNEEVSGGKDPVKSSKEIRSHLGVLYSAVPRLHPDADAVIQVDDLSRAGHQRSRERCVGSCAIVEAVDGTAGASVVLQTAVGSCQ